MISDETMLEIAITVARLFELAGIGVIVLGTLLAIGVCLRSFFAGPDSRKGVFPHFRRTLGQSILTGLELLVAADIIRTVAVDPTMESVAVLGVIVLIRTFLSLSLEVEIEGRWPWQRKRHEQE